MGPCSIQYTYSKGNTIVSCSTCGVHLGKFKDAQEAREAVEDHKQAVAEEMAGIH